MKLTRYINDGDYPSVIDLQTILDVAKEKQGFFASAEESGSEGCYVEVARWEHGADCHTGRWCRYAFLKCFGGEDMTLERQGVTIPEQLGSVATADRIAARINLASGSHQVPFIHKLPNYGSKPEPNPLIPVAERLLVACRAGLNGLNFWPQLTHEELRKLGDMLINAITDAERAGLTTPPQPTRLVPLKENA